MDGWMGSVELVGEVTVAADLALGASQGVVLGEDLDGTGEFLEEVVLGLGHFHHEGAGERVVGDLVVDHEQSLVIQDVAVVVVVEFHGRAAVVADVLHGLRVWDRVRALLEHVRHVVRVQGRVDLRVETVHQLHAVGSADAVRAQECDDSRSVNPERRELFEHHREALVVVREKFL